MAWTKMIDRGGGSEKCSGSGNVFWRQSQNNLLMVWIYNVKEQNVKNNFKFLVQTTFLLTVLCPIVSLIICFALKSILNYINTAKYFPFVFNLSKASLAHSWIFFLKSILKSYKFYWVNLFAFIIISVIYFYHLVLYFLCIILLFFSIPCTPTFYYSDYSSLFSFFLFIVLKIIYFMFIYLVITLKYIT